MTIVPLSVYLSERGLVKVKIGLARGKAAHDKRQDIKERDTARELAANCELLAIDGDEIRLRLAPEHRQLAAGRGTRRFEEALAGYFGRTMRAHIEIGAREAETPAQIAQREAVIQREQAVKKLQSDPGVIALVDAFGGHLEADSITPTD